MEAPLKLDKKTEDYIRVHPIDYYFKYCFRSLFNSYSENCVIQIFKSIKNSINRNSTSYE